MPNQYTRAIVNASTVAERYLAGESVAALAQKLGVHKRRIRQALAEEGVSTRSSTDHLAGNRHALRIDLTREELSSKYLDEGMSIRSIEQTTGCTTVYLHLLKHGVPLRSSTEHRIGKGDSLSPASRARVAAAITGPKNWNWKGGLTAVHRKYYTTPEWRRLARQCKERDNFTCQRCRAKLSGRRLRAHHIIPRGDGGPDDLSNLITLCNPCHRRTHVEIARRAAVMQPNAA